MTSVCSLNNLTPRIWDTALSFISPQGLVFLIRHSNQHLESMNALGCSRSSLVGTTSKCLSKWNDYLSFMRVFNHSPVVLSCPLEHVCVLIICIFHMSIASFFSCWVPLLWGVPVMHNCPCQPIDQTPICYKNMILSRLCIIQTSSLQWSLSDSSLHQVSAFLNIPHHLFTTNTCQVILVFKYCFSFSFINGVKIFYYLEIWGLVCLFFLNWVPALMKTLWHSTSLIFPSWSR